MTTLVARKPIAAQVEVVEQTKTYVEGLLSGEGSGHDWWHTYRVWRLASNIGKEEQADCTVVELAALLHDVYDWKFNDGKVDKAVMHAREYLFSLNIEATRVEHVCEIISTMSFKGDRNAPRPNTIEGQIVQDADRLDAIGAIGISRVFSYGGFKKREIYNPYIQPITFTCKESYLSNKGTSINHFYEKLLLLHQTMNTNSARTIALSRHRFLERYLKEFFLEWEGFTGQLSGQAENNGQLELDFSE
jgi:uncharacterized protein